MDDFIELGIEATNRCIDKHFDKIPDKALHSKTYRPRNIKNVIAGKLRDDGHTKKPVKDGLGGDESESDEDTLDERRYRGDDYRGRQSLNEGQKKRFEPNYGYRGEDATYEQDGPYLYNNSPPPSRNKRRGDEDFDNNSLSPSRRNQRQQDLRRRSSLPPDEIRSRDLADDREYEDKKETRNNGRRSTVSERNSLPHRRISKSTNKAPDNEAGLRYGAVGAMLGGLAAQELAAKKPRGGSNDKVALAMLGAAVGAFAEIYYLEKVESGIWTTVLGKSAVPNKLSVQKTCCDRNLSIRHGVQLCTLYEHRKAKE
ncbi:hypothetical protein sscle_04g036280 [Sclerotinia sclerotiorum 1980 UF-70]|uniref:Glycine zipper 2TM domain-containing protein n=1 Tax=Sclerotinia sclerotiorum (strain ATCC 18683 / 1980 / Ss-1) TaxID=665079 RepID=A0A1D9Q1N5_SCLS1|nr:hypothetical protein sscle_04g036280 [Sclerotinia sclerotiorum 1980 UF-70]